MAWDILRATLTALFTRQRWPKVTSLQERDDLKTVARQLCHERRAHKGYMECPLICRRCEREAVTVLRNMRAAKGSPQHRRNLGMDDPPGGGTWKRVKQITPV